jgi:CTP synthase
MCQVEQDRVLAVHNVLTTYHVPLLLHKQNLINTISHLLELQHIRIPDSRVSQGKHIWENWIDLTRVQDHTLDTVTIALVGKYTSLHDAYISVSKALEHAAMYCRKKLELVWVDASHLEDETEMNAPTLFRAAWEAVHKANGSKYRL